MKKLKIVVTILAFLSVMVVPINVLLAGAPAYAAGSIGGFDTSRGGSYSFPSGASLDQARTSLNTNFPETSFTAFSTLTPTALADIEILMLTSAVSNGGHIVPLSNAEQNALFDFVQGGGCAILFPDNSRFGGGSTQAANESLIDPFSMDIAETLNGKVIATVVNPSASPVTSGPFGIISSFSQNYPGGLTNLGPFAISLATNPLGDALAVIEPGAINTRSGRVVIYTDINTFGDDNAAGFFSENEELFLNTINFCKETEFHVTIDIKPSSYPNSINYASNGLVPAAIIGTEDLDITTVDPASIRLVGVAPLRSALEDVDEDGFDDLTLKFNTQEILQAIEVALDRMVEDGEEIILSLTGNLVDETPILGEDVVVIKKKGKGKGKK